ncbi:uncharacterized protein [Penaeus vannamei]|uniref:uncharacterized protein n=1 Tax=Penaeus vannamei TaxID=6689 RepID=UPI00387F3BA6
MNRSTEGLDQSSLHAHAPCQVAPWRQESQEEENGVMPIAPASLTAPHDPDRENTDDSGMGADLEYEERGDAGDGRGEREHSVDEDGAVRGRRTSSAGKERQRRPSYTCYHGPPLPRNAPRVGRRARPRPPRDLDVLQLAAGASIMLAPVTPELLR